MVEEKLAYRVELSPRADRQFKKLNRAIQLRLAPKINSLAENPRPVGVKKLEAKNDFYRIRVGDYRIVYQINDEMLFVLVLTIAHRSDVYR